MLGKMTRSVLNLDILYGFLKVIALEHIHIYNLFTYFSSFEKANKLLILMRHVLSSTHYFEVLNISNISYKTS